MHPSYLRKCVLGAMLLLLLLAIFRNWECRKSKYPAIGREGIGVELGERERGICPTSHRWPAIRASSATPLVRASSSLFLLSQSFCLFISVIVSVSSHVWIDLKVARKGAARGSGRENSQCEGHRTGAWLSCVSDTEETGVAGVREEKMRSGR